jgi:hypothetical protein
MGQGHCKWLAGAVHSTQRAAPPEPADEKSLTCSVTPGAPTARDVAIGLPSLQGPQNSSASMQQRLAIFCRFYQAVQRDLPLILPGHVQRQRQNVIRGVP